jgi:hypothetical protein
VREPWTWLEPHEQRALLDCGEIPIEDRLLIRRTPLIGIALEATEEWLPILKKRKNPHGLMWPLPSGARRGKGK